MIWVFSMPPFKHQSVLSQELIAYLKPQANQNFIDGTLGGGGHSKAILQKTGPSGKVLAIELDERALIAAKQNLIKYQDRLIVVHDSYAHLKKIYQEHKNFGAVSGIIVDLGLSSDQLDQAQRGFSFKDQGKLDMRFDATQDSLTASDIILNWSEANLFKIFKEYGEELQAKRLAKGLVLWREAISKQKQKYIETPMLVSAILRILNIKESDLKKFRRHPATKVFQALRIAVNQELTNLQAFLPQAVEILVPGGQLAVISFHSLEDRIVKQFFQKSARPCICPPASPQCVCGLKPSLKIISKKAVKPSEEEVSLNPRSRSAILRVAQKI